MANIRTRGGAALELALLVPVVCSLLVVFLNLSFLFLHQFRLEQLATEGARRLGLERLETAGECQAFVTQWLIERGFPQIVPQVELEIIPTVPVNFPRASTPVKVVQLQLLWEDRPAFPTFFPRTFTLSSVAREVML